MRTGNGSVRLTTGPQATCCVHPGPGEHVDRGAQREHPAMPPVSLPGAAVVIASHEQGDHVAAQLVARADVAAHGGDVAVPGLRHDLPVEGPLPAVWVANPARRLCPWRHAPGQALFDVRVPAACKQPDGLVCLS